MAKTKWKDIKDATTAPIGYKWQNNGKSRFSKEYKSRLVKINKNKSSGKSTG